MSLCVVIGRNAYQIVPVRPGDRRFAWLQGGVADRRPLNDGRLADECLRPFEIVIERWIGLRTRGQLLLADPSLSV